MIKFTRNLKSTAIVVLDEDVTENELFEFVFQGSGETGRCLSIGTDRISLVVCPHAEIGSWRIESLAKQSDVVIWYTGTLEACLAKFQEITDAIRELEHVIEEPEGYDFEAEFRQLKAHRIEIEEQFRNRSERIEL